MTLRRRWLSTGLALAALGGAARAGADGWTTFGATPSASVAAKPGVVSKPVRWWSIPRTARTAAKNLAASRDASVSRCVAIEQDDQILYEFHASRRLGFLKKQDFVLTSISEPKTVSEKRKEQQSLKGRLARLREPSQPQVPARISNPNGYVVPESR